MVDGSFGAQTAPQPQPFRLVFPMTFSAVVFLGTVWTFVAGMMLYCYAKMLRSKQRFQQDDDPDE